MIDACLAACSSSSRPRQALRTFKSHFFHPLHRIVFHPATRERKRGYTFFFWVCNFSLLVMFLLLFLKDLDGICIYLRLLTFLLFAFFIRLLLTFFFFLFSLLAVVPRSG